MAAVTEALRTGTPGFIDLHRDDQSGESHVAVITPILPPAGSALGASGAVIFIANAGDYLYPLIRSWPVPRASAESLLVRRDGDEVTFLNELRHRADTALRLRFPITETTLPAQQAVLGAVGIVTGKDYRGVDVIADLEPIPDSPWYLVAKIDRAEALTGWRIRAALTAAFVAALGLILGTLVLVGTQRAEKERYRLLYQAEAARRASDERYRAIISAMPDLFFRLDGEGRFLDYQTSNPAKLLVAPEFFIGKTVREVMPPQVAGPAATAIAQALATGETQSFEYELETNGRREWFDQRVVKVSADEVITITRDISASRRSALLAEMRLYLLAFASTHSLDELLVETLDRVGEMVNSPVGSTILSSRIRRRSPCRPGRRSPCATSAGLKARGCTTNSSRRVYGPIACACESRSSTTTMQLSPTSAACRMATLLYCASWSSPFFARSALWPSWVWATSRRTTTKRIWNSSPIWPM